MKEHVAAVRLVDRDEATEAVELPEELRLPLGAIAGVAREGLVAVCTTVGLAVMGEMMTAEMTAKVGGPKHAKLAQRRGTKFAPAQGLAAGADVRRCARRSPPSCCSTGMGCCTSRVSGPTDAHRPVVATRRWTPGTASAQALRGVRMQAPRSCRRRRGRLRARSCW